MPITTSAKKALRASARKKLSNDSRKIAMKKAVKQAHMLALSGKIAEAEKLMASAYQAIDKAAKRGVINAGNAARKKSRLSAFLKKTKTTK